MIEGRTILCFASSYDAPPTSKHHVMRVLAERNTVLWVNYHGSRRPGATRSDITAAAAKLRQAAGGPKRRDENLTVMTPLVLPMPSSPEARRLNRWLLARQLRAAIRRLGARTVDVWSFAPDIAYVLDSLPVSQVVYYCVDDFAQFDGYDADRVRAAEADLVGKADLVVTTSQALQDAKAMMNPRSILIPHGVDHAHFAAALSDDLAEPDDVAPWPHPRLGFVGLVHEWVDTAMLADLARRRPDWQLVLVGPSNGGLGELRSLPNVHLLGLRPYAQLPAYCKAFDVGLIPFVVNDLTRAVNPIKLREYLAAGLPVVSAPLPEVLRCGQTVMTAETAEEYIEAIEKILAEPAAARVARSSAVRDQGWRAKVETICRALSPSAGGQAEGSAA